MAVAGCAREAPPAWEPKKPGSPPRATTQPKRTKEVSAQAFLDRKERWPVKVGADERAKTIDVSDAALDRANVKSVAELIALGRPHGLPAQARGKTARSVRFGKEETTIYRIDCILVEAKYEDDDKDYHVVIRDPYGDATKTMIVEIPRPDVVPTDSPFWHRIKQARDTFDARFDVGKKFEPLGARARVWGVGFFDFVHGQRGVAPNGIELHPVLKLEFK